MFAVRLGAVTVERKRMVLKLKPARASDFHLPLLDLGIDELLDPPALQANQMVMMLAVIELEQGSSRLEVAAFENPCLFELRKNPINRRKANVVFEPQQLAKYILRAHVALTALLEDLQYFQPGGRGLQAAATQFERGLHRKMTPKPGRKRVAGRVLCIIKVMLQTPGKDPWSVFSPILPTRDLMFHHAPRRPWPRALGGVALAALLVGLVGCSSNDPTRSGFLEPYRIDLPQGNYVTQAMLERIRPGMSPEQVRDLLGSPLLGHVFHADRWDYVFRFKHPNGSSEQRKVTVRFRNGRVSSIDSDPLPSKEDPADPALPGFKPSQRRS
jgi:outer membrane protein assembly factor BamE